jgi:outer membrane protein assembly factor BamB
MWLSLRRAICTLVLVAGLTCVSMLHLAPAQQPVPKQPPTTAAPKEGGETTDLDKNIALPRDNALRRKMEAVQDYIKSEDWVKACQLLQFIVEGDQDVFVPVKRTGADGGETSVDVSIKKEANRLIANLPAKGQEFYKLNYGQLANDKLKEAREQRSKKLLAEVIRSYQHTEAGLEATGLLAKYLLDSGDSEGAAQCFQRLFERVGIAKLPALTLFQAAYAFHQSADTENENRAWRELSTRTKEVRLGNTVKSVEELKAYVRGRSPSATEANRSDWPVVFGNSNRNGRGEGDTACMEARFTDKTVKQAEVEGLLKKAAQKLQQSGQPVISAFSPVAATITSKTGQRLTVVVYRTTWGVYALDTRSGKQIWYNGSQWSLDPMFADSKKRPTADQWINQLYLTLRPNMLFENSTIGTLSTNGSYVFVIDDLPVTPPPSANVNFQPQNVSQNPPLITEALKANTLMAYDLASGKLKWVLDASPMKAQGGTEKETYHPDTLFLGPPLPLSGRLFVLAEKQQELQLLTLDAQSGHVLQRQLLGKTRDKLAQDGPRRSKAAHLACGEGMLICPTNAGAIFGYDLLDKSLVWAYHYREAGGPEEMPRLQPGRGLGPPWVQGPDGRFYNPNGSNNWKVTPPIVQDGKVVFTAPDAANVHCLALRDGSPLWSVKRAEDDYYLGGVFNGKVLIIGKRTVKALDLATGKQVWATGDAGIPSGVGTASENLYYLPVKEAPGSKEPEIVAIDIDTGNIAGRSRSRLREIPGNLIFFEGDVVSQTATDLAVYPLMKTKLAQIDELIRKNPNDPVGLTERGELRLDRNDLRGAVEDLTLALENKPPPEVLGKTQSRLFDALTHYLLRDYDAAEKYLKYYEDLCKVEVKGNTPEQTAALEKEARRRKANLLFLVGRGKEGQRKLVEAFQKYEEIGALPVGADDLITPPDEPSVRGRPEVLARGRIAALMSAAKPEERRPLEELIATRWQEAKKNGNAYQLRRFVAQYGSLFEAGREARLVLANQLVEDTDPASLLEAERQLTLLRHQSGGNRRLVARAIEALARLSTRKGLLEDAGYYYTLLGTEYAKEDLGDGRTGADVYNDMATDKRIRPYLDRKPGLGGSGPIQFEKTGGTPMPLKIYHFEPVGERLPYFRSHEVTLRIDRNELVLADAQTGKELWVQGLRPTQFGLIATPPIRPARSGESSPSSVTKATVLTMGHLVVLPLGQMVFGIDPINRKIIWEKDLQAPLPGPGQPASGVATGQLVVDERDGSVQMIYNDGWMQQLGLQTGPLQGDAVYLQSKEGLVALDPLTGHVLWVRSDMPSRCHLFGDEQNLYMVEHNAANKPSATRAVRASDGATVKVPDFTTAYRNRLKVLGHRLLVADTPDKGAPPAPTVLRLYDVVTGKDVWSVTYEAGTQVLEPEARDFAGVVDSKGRIHIHDAATGREIASTEVRDAADIEGAWVGHLVSDRDQVYVAFSRPIDRTQVAINGINTNVMPGTGLRTLPVNGSVYAFLQTTGKLHWKADVPNQMLVLEQFEDLPFLLFTSRYQKATGMNQSSVQVINLCSVDKRTGKRLILDETLPTGTQQFHALRVDNRAGKIEFISYNLTAVHWFNPPARPLSPEDATK